MNRFEKTAKIELNADERENYFLFVRNFLQSQRVTTGNILQYWIDTQDGDSREAMQKSNTVKVNIRRIDELIKTLKTVKSKFSLKGYELIDKIEYYATI